MRTPPREVRRETRLNTWRPRWFGVVLLLAVVAGTVACGGNHDDRRLSVVFDGARCEYEGPDSVPAGDIDVSFTNDSDDPAGLAFLSIPVGTPVDPGVGADGPITTPEPGGGSEVVGVIELDPRKDATELAALAPGTHVLDCVTFGPDGPKHFWRGAILDVER